MNYELFCNFVAKSKIQTNMILIADSGSTKTDWTLLHSTNPFLKSEEIATFRTQGITPIHQTAGDIRDIIERELLPQLSSFPRAKLIQSGVLESPLLQNLHLFFYGSGCTPAHVPMMIQLMNEELSPKTVEVHSDLMAAARALCGHEAGMACILGTGANSCLYDGENIVQNTPALGYILGDEGSGSVLGRLFLNAIFKNPALANVRCTANPWSTAGWPPCLRSSWSILAILISNSWSLITSATFSVRTLCLTTVLTCPCTLWALWHTIIMIS